MYLESSTRDPNCDGNGGTTAQFCGPEVAYMVYNGDPFCVQNAIVSDKWFYIDFSVGAYINDPPVTVESNCDN